MEMIHAECRELTTAGRMSECPCEHEPQLDGGDDGDDGAARLSGFPCLDFSPALCGLVLRSSPCRCLVNRETQNLKA